MDVFFCVCIAFVVLYNSSSFLDEKQKEHRMERMSCQLTNSWWLLRKTRKKWKRKRGRRRGRRKRRRRGRRSRWRLSWSCGLFPTGPSTPSVSTDVTRSNLNSSHTIDRHFLPFYFLPNDQLHCRQRLICHSARPSGAFANPWFSFINHLHIAPPRKDKCKDDWP